MDADLDRERAANQPSANRLTLLSAEVRLQKQQGEKWARSVLDRVEAVANPVQESWTHQKAANDRWSGNASGATAIQGGL